MQKLSTLGAQRMCWIQQGRLQVSGEVKNVTFLCDGCIPAAKKNMCEKSTSLSEELVELKTSVEEVKASIGALS